MRTVFFILLLTIAFVAKAQTKTTKETKVITVVTNSIITAIEHFESLN